MHNVRKIVTLVILAVMVAAPFVLLPFVSTRTLSPAAAQQAANTLKWSAAAPGKVEPKGGDYRVAAVTLGRISEVRVKAGDLVQAGEIVVRLDDAELAARLTAVQADAALKKFARDDQKPEGRLKRRYDADDAVVSAEQKQIAARAALDRALEAAHGNPSLDAEVTKARTQLQSADAALAKARKTLEDLRAESGDPKTNQYETALIAANGQLAVIQALIEQTRVRAPVSGTALQVNAKIGDVASPQNPEPLAILGDLSALRVRAEIDERDVGRVKAGQKAVVRSDTFRGQDFPATVTSVARALTSSKLSPRGPRRQSEAEVLEAFVTFDGAVPLPAGLRVDVYFIDGQ